MFKTPFSPFPQLYTEQLELSQLAEHHLHDLHALRTHAEVLRYLQRPAPKSLEDTLENIHVNQQLLQNQEGIAWAISKKNENKLIGVIGFWRIKKEHYRPEIGYLLLPEYWGQGIMSEAIQATLRFAFEQMNAHTVEADINPENSASAKILLRNGFKREGAFKENIFFEGVFYDSEVYSLLKSDWINAKP
jgi:[ribosomal protein S5]-alanine N-acetyltransferase